MQVLPQKGYSLQRNNVRAQEENEKEGAAQRSHFVPGATPVPRSFWLPPVSLKGLMVLAVVTREQSRAWSELALGNLEERYVKVCELFPQKNKLNSLS